MDTALTVLFLGILVFLAHFFTVIFSFTKVPDVLFLIIIGIFVGPLLGILTPAHFGVVGPMFTTVTVVIILFEAGLSLRLDILGKAMRGTLTLTAISFFITMSAIGIVTWVLTELGSLTGFMLGAIVGGTSSAVVIPLVRQLKMQSESGAILLLESALNDVLVIVFTLTFLEVYKLGEFHFGLITGQIISSFILASIFGIIGGFLWSILLKKVHSLQNAIFTTPAFVFVLFGIVESLGYSGYISSLAFGITLGNIQSFNLAWIKRYIPQEPVTLNETEKLFFSEIVFLLRAFFFVYLGLSMQLRDIEPVTIGLILTGLIFILRIPVVRFSVNKSTPIADASLMAVMVPKGLAAAVLASIPLQRGVAGGEFIQNVTYAVVLFSTIFTTLSVFLLDKTKLSKVYGRIFSGFGRTPQPSIETQKATDEKSVNTHT